MAEALWTDVGATDDRSFATLCAGTTGTRLDRVPPGARVLYAAHTALPWPQEPHRMVWHASTLLREHRGDGHNLALAAADEESAAAVVTGDVVAESVNRALLRYDKNGDEHYDVISAFIKSVRGSDADAALHYLARMFEAGEDPRFIARRLVILASAADATGRSSRRCSASMM